MQGKSDYDTTSHRRSEGQAMIELPKIYYNRVCRVEDVEAYGKACAAEAREQMREELIAHWKKQRFMTLNPEDSAQNQRVQGMKSCNQNYIEYLERLK